MPRDEDKKETRLSSCVDENYATFVGRLVQWPGLGADP